MAAFFRSRGAKYVVAPRAAAPRTEEQVRQILQVLPRYRVLLHNDDVNTQDYVIYVLFRTVPALSFEGAERIMLEAEAQGCAEVTICPKELAEHYQERLEGFGLTSTIEPV